MLQTEQNPAAPGRRRRIAVWPIAAIMVVILVVSPILLGPWRDRRPAQIDGPPAQVTQVTQAFPSGPAVSAPASAEPAVAATTTSAVPAAPRDPTAPFPAAKGKRWALSFREEFSGTGYDHSKLSPCFDWNDGDCTASFNSGREAYRPAQVQVSNGTAKLTAEPARKPISSSACQNGTCTYVAGLLSTARPRAEAGQKYLYRFTYGYVEARLKFPATQGFFTAFWMLPADPSFDYQTEIDILEMLGDDPTTMFMTYSYGGRAKSYNVNTGKHNNGACPVKDYSRDFVRVGMDWEPGRIAWYIDGKKCAEYAGGSTIESGPMQIILHMMVDNNWQRQWNVGLADPSLKRRLEVDYLRVFQQHPA
jgi:hypothetical protein